MACLPRSFFDRTALQVARDLLGCHLVRLEASSSGTRLVGIITETEAYQGEEDQGCHARAGRTPRTEVMYGPPGHAYIYFTYGMHWLLNAVTGPVGVPAAVLLRAMLPVEGQAVMVNHRPFLAYSKQWTNGPAKLTQALDLKGDLNGCDLCDPVSPLFIEDKNQSIPDEQVKVGPRVGLFTVPEPWKSIPWRFQVTMDVWK